MRQEERRLSLLEVTHYAGLLVQATLSTVVVLFCCYKLTFHQPTDSDKSVYVGLLTGTLGYWFPNPTGALPYRQPVASPSRRRSSTQSKDTRA